MPMFFTCHNNGKDIDLQYSRSDALKINLYWVFKALSFKSSTSFHFSTIGNK